MSFLDKLQDAGIGQRGPYGRMESGAQKLNQTLGNWDQQHRSAGVSKVIAQLAAKGQITSEDQIAISDKWGVPLQEVMQLVKPINTEAESKRLEKMGKTFYDIYQSRKQRNPGFKFTHKDVMQMAREAKATSNEDVAYLLQGTRKIAEQKKYFNIGAGSRLGSATDGEDPKIEIEAQYPPAKPTKPVEEKLYPLSPDVKLVNKTGKEIARGIKKPADSGSSTDFQKAYEQHIAIPGNEKTTAAEFRTKNWQQEGGILSDGDAYKALESFAYTIDPLIAPIFTAEFEALRKQGASRNDAYNKVVNDYKEVTSQMPPAKQHADKVVRDNNTGKRYKSDGTNWIPVR